MARSPHAVWTSAAGAATTAFGVALLGVSQISGGPPLEWTIGALFSAAALEVAAGVFDERRGGAWMARIFSIALALSFASLFVSILTLPQDTITAPPIALVFGIFCLANALFRGLDLLVDRPGAAVPEVIDVIVTFVLSVVLLSNWRYATTTFLGTVGGIELLTGGFSLAGTARVLWPPPELSGYENRRMLH